MKRLAYLGAEVFDLSALLEIGSGGEALIYRLPKRDQVLKIYRLPDDPFYSANPATAKQNMLGARARLGIVQRKLPSFPADLPSHVVRPLELSRDSLGGLINGYSMPFIRDAQNMIELSKRDIRTSRGITENDVVEIFRGLHDTVKSTHRAQVVIGDFNNMNVMVRGKEAFIIDADSMQWGKFPAFTFTPRYVDPLICKANEMIMARRHSELTDWYAFALMFFETLLYVHPYRGVYRPKDLKRLVPMELRPLHRISVFHPEVGCPSHAIPYQYLSDEMLEYYSALLEKDKRGEFPAKLLEQRWTKCLKCGVEHARTSCPKCALPVLPENKVAVIKARASAERVFRTVNGVIVAASLGGGKLSYLYHEDQAFRRENGSVVIEMPLAPDLKFRLNAKRTVISKGQGSRNKSFILEDGAPPKEILTEQYRDGDPVYDCNSKHIYWVYGGQLYHDTERSPFSIGEIMPNQTRIWVGEEFGLAYYRVDQFHRAQIFDAENAGLIALDLPKVSGRLVDIGCYFTKSRVWLLLATELRGKITHRAFLFRSDGTAVATAEAEEGDGSWLGETVHSGKCGAVLKNSKNQELHLLLAASSDGLIGVMDNGDKLMQKLEFPDTHGLVDAASTMLYDSKRGLYVVRRGEISLVKTN